MLTKEQIKNLKRGTPIVIRTTFNRVDEDGDIWFRAPTYIGGSMEDCIHPSFVSLPSEHGTSVPTTTRPFKEGDKVRVVERDGRSYVDAPPVGATCRVIVGEDSFGMVTVEFKFSENEEPAVHNVPFYHLELINPVEELEPYSVEEDSHYWHVLYEQNGGKVTVCKFLKSYHPTAKAAAEAECKRLNEEYRKEPDND